MLLLYDGDIDFHPKYNPIFPIPYSLFKYSFRVIDPLSLMFLGLQKKDKFDPRLLFPV